MACITVFAGTNGAGKSSIGGARLREVGGSYFNPDEATTDILVANPSMKPDIANGMAWQQGKQQLESAIRHGGDYAFETTLGGNTMVDLLISAAKAGFEIVLWYAGLDGQERHLARIRSRVAKGGHDIPEGKVRERYHASLYNLIKLMPFVSALRVYDNSTESDPSTGVAPRPRLVLSFDHGKVGYPLSVAELQATPEWAQPVVAHAMNLAAAASGGWSA